jgi:peptidylprolyl isomerase
MAEVKSGDTVKVHYTGKLTNGEQFDSSVGREPLEFTVGAGMMIAGFDAAMPGMKVGDKENVPADMKLEIGQQLTLSNEQGQPFPVVVKELREEIIILDANHFLAGKELVFDIELVEIGV